MKDVRIWVRGIPAPFVLAVPDTALPLVYDGTWINFEETPGQPDTSIRVADIVAVQTSAERPWPFRPGQS